MSHAALFPTITGAHWRAMFRRERGAGNAVRAQILSRVGRAGELEPMGLLRTVTGRPANPAVAKGGRSITDTNWWGIKRPTTALRARFTRSNERTDGNWNSGTQDHVPRHHAHQDALSAGGARLHPRAPRRRRLPWRPWVDFAALRSRDVEPSSAGAWCRLRALPACGAQQAHPRDAARVGGAGAGVARYRPDVYPQDVMHLVSLCTPEQPVVSGLYHACDQLSQCAGRAAAQRRWQPAHAGNFRMHSWRSM